MPLVAALILVYRAEGLSGVRDHLAQVFDQRKIRPIMPLFLLAPTLSFLNYLIQRCMGLPLHAEPANVLVMIPLLFVLFFVLAIGEEAGWTGYATDPLQSRWSALATAIMLGHSTCWIVLRHDHSRAADVDRRACHRWSVEAEHVGGASAHLAVRALAQPRNFLGDPVGLSFASCVPVRVRAACALGFRKILGDQPRSEPSLSWRATCPRWPLDGGCSMPRHATTQLITKAYDGLVPQCGALN
jgi:hypothetical protein